MKPRPKRRRVGIWAGAAPNLEAARVRHEIALHLSNSVDLDYMWLDEAVYRGGTVGFRWSSLHRKASAREVATPHFARAADFSAVLSFDYRDEIWSWPLRQLGIGSVCVLSDLLPFRTCGTQDTSGLYKALLRMVGEATTIICPSEATASAVELAVSAARGKVRVVYAGSDSASPRPLKPRDFLGLSRTAVDTTVLTFDAGAHANAHMLLAAAPGLARLLGPRGVRIIFAGDGESTERHFADHYGPLLRQARTGVDVAFEKATATVDGPLIETANVVVQLGGADGFGLSLLDAMHVGTTTVAADSPSFREIGGGTALLCNIYDTRDVERTIAAAASASGRSRALTISTALLWASSLTWARSAAAFHKILQIVAHKDATFATPRVHPRKSIQSPEIRGSTDRSEYDAAYVVDIKSFADEEDVSASALLELIRRSPLDDGVRRALILVADEDIPDLDIRSVVTKLVDLRRTNPMLDFGLLLPETRELNQSVIREPACLLIDLIEARAEVGNARETFPPMAEHALLCATVFIAEERLISRTNNSRIRAKRTILLSLEDQVTAPVASIGDTTLRDLVIARRGLEARASQYYFNVVQNGSLGELIDAHERPSGEEAASRHDASRPWLRSPFDRLEEGLSCLLLPEPFSKVDRSQDNVRSSDPDVLREVVCLTNGDRKRGRGRYRLRLYARQSIETLCFAAASVVGGVSSDGRLTPGLLLAIRLEKPVLLIGDAHLPILRLFPNVTSAPRLDDDILDSWLGDLAPARHEVQGRVMPPYPPGAGLLLALVRKSEQKERLSQSDREDIRHLAAQPMMPDWIAHLERSELTKIFSEQLAALMAYVKPDLTPAPLASTRKVSTAASDDLATRISACGGSEDWSTLECGWRTGATEQIARLYRESSIDTVVICGERGQETQIRCFDDFDPAFLDACLDEDISVIFAGGVGAVPLPGSRLFVTGPIASVAPALEFSRFGLIPRLRPALGRDKLLRLARYLRDVDIITFCPAELVPNMSAIWENRSDKLVSFDDVSELRRYLSSDLDWRRPSRGSYSPSLLDFKEIAAVSPALSHATSSVWSRRPDLHSGVGGVECLALPKWRLLSRPGRLRDITIRLPGLNDPENQALGLCSGFYSVESDATGRAFRWLGPSDRGTVRLPATASGDARLSLRITRLGECSEADIAVLVQGREVPLTWTRDADAYVAKSKRWKLADAQLIDVTIEARRSFQPGGRDARTLRIAISDLTITIGSQLRATSNQPLALM